VNSQDEIVNGFLIPKGTLIGPNNVYVAMNPNIPDHAEGVKVHTQRSECVGRSRGIQAGAIPRSKRIEPSEPDDPHIWIWRAARSSSTVSHFKLMLFTC
jgi:hypothetical protein